MNTISFTSEVGKIETMSDKSLKVLLRTAELPPEMMTQLFRLQNQACAVAIAPHGEKPEVLPPVTESPPSKRSQSQRIRDILFILWEHNKQGYEFDDFYNMRTEKLIESIKEELNHYK